MTIRHPVRAFSGIAWAAYEGLARLREWTRRLG